MDPYQQLLNRKRKWSPVEVTAGDVKDEVHDVLKRILAIRHMELPVGDFIAEALKKEVPSNSRVLLESNITDEINHDKALGYIANAHGIDAQAEAEAMRLRDAWISHPDHTILKAMVAERAIFFVILPFLRFHGDAGMRTVSADISRDEQTHVACNSLICAELNLKPSQSLDKLRKATINWILSPLKAAEDKKFDKNFWLNSSDNLMYQGKAPELSDTRRARMPAFFEHANPNLPQYA